MKHILIFLILTTLNTFADKSIIFEANMVGTNLVPLTKTDVELKNIRVNFKARSGSKYVKVKTNYILNNPSKSKKIIVGFEAGKTEDKFSKISPYLLGITLKVNDKHLKNIAYTPFIPHEFADGIKNQKELKKMLLTSNSFDDGTTKARHLYLFELELNKGFNHVMFEYTYVAPKDIITHYKFEHDLASFSTWANKKVDSFNLSLNLGKFQAFRLEKGFFQSKSELKYNGKVIDNPKYSYVTVYSKDGIIKFKQKDFSVQKRFKIFSFDNNFGLDFEDKIFNYKKDKLGFMFEDTRTECKGWKSDHILRALPYARRGFVFKRSKGVQDYFESLDWYKKNPKLKRSDVKFTAFEKKILKGKIAEASYDEGLENWNKKGD